MSPVPVADWRHMAGAHDIPAGEAKRMSSAFEHDDFQLAAGT